MDVASLLIGATAGAAAVGGALWVVRQAALTAQRELASERARVLELTQERARLASTLEQAQAQAATRLADAEQQRAQVRLEIEHLANRLLDEKGKALLVDQQVGMAHLLTPLRERIKAFEEQVGKTYDQDNRDRATLFAHLKRLDEAQVRLNHEAQTLSRALTGESKTQGDWGEMVLEKLLEAAGLEEGREFTTQSVHTDDAGSRLRPDVIVHLPGNKAVVVDSKVAITAFVTATMATEEPVREAALTAHRAAVRTHIKALAGKRYPELLAGRTLDFTVLFVPSEVAFHAALARDHALYHDAYREGIILASPTTLLATLRVVHLVWQYEKQNSNALRIAEEAGKLLEKFVSFADDLGEVGNRLRQAQGAWDSAKGKLDSGPGNLASKAKLLAKLGAKLTKGGKVGEYLAGTDEAE